MKRTLKETSMMKIKTGPKYVRNAPGKNIKISNSLNDRFFICFACAWEPIYIMKKEGKKYPTMRKIADKLTRVKTGQKVKASN